MPAFGGSHVQSESSTDALRFAQVSALLVYILCGFFVKSFIAQFVVVILLLMMDFWIVSSLCLRVIPTLDWYAAVVQAPLPTHCQY